MSKSSDYWRKREEEWLAQIRKSEKAQAEEVQAIYDYMLDQIEKEINSFFEKYAAKEGITMAEAKKRADTIDIEAYMRKAAKYVKEKDFSEQANKEMLLYNMTMKVNRLELLKSSIGLDLVAGHDELKTYMGEKLTDHVVETLRHNAAILGPTVMNDADRKARVIVDSSFHNATFSDRIWQHQDKLRNEMTNILTSALIGGRNPREFIPTLRKRFDVSARDAERLLRTELARVQTEAQKESYKDENINEYEYIACGLADCCDICRALDGKHFKVSKMVPGENAPPMHPNCHCSTGPYIDRKEYDEWLDSYNQHHMSYSDWIEHESIAREEGLRTKKGMPNAVNWKIVKSKEYSQRFSKLSENTKANELAAQRARKALKHRDGTMTEEIYAIDLKTGKDISRIVNQNYIQGVKRTKKFIEDVERAEANGANVLFIHNHPNGLIPSLADLNELLNHKNASGLVVGHDGSIYFYTKPDIKLSENDFTIAYLKSRCYTDVKLKNESAMEELARMHKFEFKVL